MGGHDDTRALLAQLRRHYIKPQPLPGGVFIAECGLNGTIGSRADALYVGFTSTSGRLLVGHELKVTRADWRKELDSAGKADFWADNCHQWIIVAPGPEVVPKEELPHGWGLMYPNPRTKTRMQVVVKPETHRDRNPSWQAVRSMFARLDTLRASEQEEWRRKVREEAQKEAEDRFAQRDRTSLTPEQQERLRTLDAVEDLLGMPVEGYVFGGDRETKVAADELAAALLLVRNVRKSGLGQTRDYEVTHLRRVGQTLIDGLDDYEQARKALLALIGR